jgi:hypothetical protein
LSATQLLATLYQIRSNLNYQAAEGTRRKSGAAEMAKSADKDLTAFGQINLLVNTWETISVLVLGLKKKDRELIFEVTPVLYMFTELSDAIDILGCKFPDYASNFRLLSKQHLEWLKFKDDKYQTGEQGGMHALFG